MTTTKFILHTNEFGFDLYIGNDGLATDTKTEAMVFDSLEDNKENKVSYYNAVSGYTLKALQN